MSRSLSAAKQVSARLVRWAKNNQPPLDIDKQGYVRRLSDNFFEPLSACTLAELAQGDGTELGREGERGKIQALHSSSALACNVFDYWRGRDSTSLAVALGLQSRLCSMRFEAKFPTGLRGKAPNLDLIVTAVDGAKVAIESKFLEPFGSPKKPRAFNDKYFPSGPGLWADILLPEAQALADRVRAAPGAFQSLDVQQLLKHLLGLGQRSPSPALLYVWFRPGGEAGQIHADEVADFVQSLAGLRIGVSALSYQALFDRLRAHSAEGHASYLAYLEARYFPFDA